MATSRNTLSAGDLDKIISIQRRSVTVNDAYGTDVVTWVTIADKIHAKIDDVVPNRQSSDETDTIGMLVASRPSRVKIRWRTDITSDMRVIVHAPARVCQITSQPNELGRRDGIEFIMHDYTTQGTGP